MHCAFLSPVWMTLVVFDVMVGIICSPVCQNYTLAQSLLEQFSSASPKTLRKVLLNDLSQVGLHCIHVHTLTDRHTDTHTDGQTDVPTPTHLCIQTLRQTDRQTDSRTDRQTDRHMNRQTDRRTDRQTHEQTGRQTDRRTDRQTIAVTSPEH